ncbi:MAG TPA: tRNA (adenosine(37)-N6)-threonylcarbamoyltransferase complex dimerization subunit type 1 TsaB [Candidatus Limnocylindrales bacterium]
MPEPWLLAIDTATSVVVVAAGRPDGSLIAERTFTAGHRHGSHLLPTIEALLAEAGHSLDDLAAVVVGLGPGAFTGLRVGLATAKTLAHARDVPIVGISTADALLAAAAAHATGAAASTPASDDVAGAQAHGHGRGAGSVTLLLPAGPHDRTIVAPGQPPRLEAGNVVPEPPGAVAVDLDGRASAGALARGREAVMGLPGALLRLGAERLAAGDVDDVERLVPVYVSLPRGVATDVGDEGVAWSRDPR